MKGLDRYIKASASRMINDIDYHDFMSMLEMGMSEAEIASELGVSDRVVKWLKNEIEKDV